jgi:hypothetical protein
MNSYSTGRRSHRSRGGSRRRGNGHARRQREETKEQKKTFWQRIAAFFGNGTFWDKSDYLLRAGH